MKHPSRRDLFRITPDLRAFRHRSGQGGPSRRLILLAAAVVLSCGSPPSETMIDQLRSDDPDRVSGATDALAARGAEAIPELQAALKDNDLRLRRRAKEILARITGQWGDGSGLRWRRTFDEAVAEASRTGKPVLLLNLFGRFDQEFC